MTSKTPETSLDKATASPETTAQSEAANTELKPWMTWACDLLQKSLPENLKTALIESLQKKSDSEGAKHEAVKRLRMVLMHDRTHLSEGTLENIRADIMGVISKYIEIDQETLDLHLEQENNRIALVANIAMLKEREKPLSEEEASDSEVSPLEQAVEKQQDELIEELLQEDSTLPASEVG